MIDMNMYQHCIPSDIAKETIAQVIKVESDNNPIAINVNGKKIHFKKPATMEEAISTAKELTDQGHNIDVGLMQINSKNLVKFNISLSDSFEPCTNISVGSLLLKDAYKKASLKFGRGQKSLQAALSIYNTGNMQDGFKNGYVSRYYPDLNSSNPYTSSSLVYAEKKERNSNEKK